MTDINGLFGYKQEEYRPHYTKMFDEGSSFNGDISKWDVSSVTNMNSTFESSSFNGDISKWDVSSVTDMSHMFESSSFNGDISKWKVTQVRNVYEMFSKRRLISVKKGFEGGKQNLEIIRQRIPGFATDNIKYKNIQKSKRIFVAKLIAWLIFTGWSALQHPGALILWLFLTFTWLWTQREDEIALKGNRRHLWPDVNDGFL